MYIYVPSFVKISVMVLNATDKTSFHTKIINRQNSVNNVDSVDRVKVLCILSDDTLILVQSFMQKYHS